METRIGKVIINVDYSLTDEEKDFVKSAAILIEALLNKELDENNYRKATSRLTKKLTDLLI